LDCVGVNWGIARKTGCRFSTNPSPDWRLMTVAWELHVVCMLESVRSPATSQVTSHKSPVACHVFTSHEFSDEGAPATIHKSQITDWKPQATTDYSHVATSLCVLSCDYSL